MLQYLKHLAMLSDLMPFTLCMNAMHEYTLPDLNIFWPWRHAYLISNHLMTKIFYSSSWFQIHLKTPSLSLRALLNYSDETFHALAIFINVRLVHLLGKGFVDQLYRLRKGELQRPRSLESKMTYCQVRSGQPATLFNCLQISNHMSATQSIIKIHVGVEKKTCWSSNRTSEWGGKGI